MIGVLLTACCVILLEVNGAWPQTVPCGELSADLNGDGRVDFNDFFILADQFGKNCDLPAPVEGLSGAVEGLAAITFEYAATNWDADDADDGYILKLWFLDANGASLPFSRDVKVAIHTEVFVDTELGSGLKKYPGPVLATDQVSSLFGSLVKIPFDDFVSRIPAEDIWNTASGGNAFSSIVYVSVTQADSSTFSYRRMFGMRLP